MIPKFCFIKLKCSIDIDRIDPFDRGSFKDRFEYLLICSNYVINHLYSN